MRSYLIAVVFVASCCGMKDAVASCRLAASLNTSYLQVPDLHRPFDELNVEALFIGSCNVLSENFSLYVETGFGYTSEHHMTWPLGFGMVLDLNDRVSLGLSTSYSSRLGYFTEGSVALGPFVQYMVFKHEHSIGHLSILLLPVAVVHFNQHHAGNLGRGLTLGAELAL